jgi:hypothetical protein
MASATSAAVRLVPEDHATIQLAIDASSAFDTLSIAPGTYTGNAYATLPVSLLARTGVPATVILGTISIDGGSNMAGTCYIRGLAFRRTDELQLVCENGRFELSQNLFDSTYTLGPAILYFPDNVQGVFENNIVRHNGWGLVAYGNTSLLVRNNIFRDCTGSGITTLSNPACTFKYNCFFNNARDFFGDALDEGNLFTDPLMDGASLGLLSGSPCIDAGDPDSPLDADGTRADIGVLKYTGAVGNRVYIDSVIASPNDTVVLSVGLTNATPVAGMTIPLRYTSTGLSLIEVIHVDRGLQFAIQSDLKDDVGQTVLLGYVALDSLLPPGDGPLAQLKFVVDGSAPEQVVSIDSTFLPPANQLVLVDLDAMEFIPLFDAGTIVVDPCPVDLPGDVQIDGKVAVSDIVYLVNYLLRSGPRPLPVEQAGDVDCSGQVTLADVVYLVNYVFKSGPPPCDMCP